jgi:nitroreductase/NAD-dependent dihydropyrimidine dehydrogenase PreA subunit
MAILEVDKQTCTQCGICAAICPRGIIYFREKSYPRLLPKAGENCARCGHCVAVCPSGSLTHIDIPVKQCPPLDRSLDVTAEQCTQLVKGRRSIRVYQDKKVSREEIERIIEVARYAPTGHNSQAVRWLVINDKDEVHRLSEIGADWMRWVIRNDPQLAPMLESALQRQESGIDVFLRDAPAVVIAFAEKSNPVAYIDCVIALSYFDLIADSMELGCCWAGYFIFAAISFPHMIEALSLPEGHQVYGALTVGYPRHKYQRIPLRKPPSITWRP